MGRPSAKAPGHQHASEDACRFQKNVNFLFERHTDYRPFDPQPGSINAKDICTTQISKASLFISRIEQARSSSLWISPSKHFAHVDPRCTVLGMDPRTKSSGINHPVSRTNCLIYRYQYGINTSSYPAKDHRQLGLDPCYQAICLSDHPPTMSCCHDIAHNRSSWRAFVKSRTLLDAPGGATFAKKRSRDSRHYSLSPM